MVDYRTRLELLLKLFCKLVNLSLKGGNKSLDGVVFEGIVTDTNEDLPDLADELFQIDILVLLYLFVDLCKGSWVLIDIAEVVNSILRNLLGH